MNTQRVSIADLLRRFVEGEVHPYEFDDFISVKQDDILLERSRHELISLPDDYPPEDNRRYTSPAGMQRILEISRFILANS
jgi:hypothetical protein